MNRLARVVDSKIKSSQVSKVDASKDQPEEVKPLTVSQVIYGIFKHQIETRQIEVAVARGNASTQGAAQLDTT